MKASRKFLACLATVCVFVALGGGCASLKAMPTLALRIEKGRPFQIVASDKSAGWGSVAHPFFCPLSSNRLMITYYIAGDGAAFGTAAVDWPCYTDDGGKSWTTGDPMQWPTGAPPPGLTTFIRKGESFSYNFGFCFGYVVQADGFRVGVPMRLTLRTDGTNSWYSAKGVFSSDGVAWDGPVDIVYRAPTNFTETIYMSSKAVQLDDGSVISVGYVVADQDRKKLGEYYTCLAFRSVDRGMSYDCCSIVAAPKDAPWGNHGPAEPGLEKLANGELLCVMRTGSYAGYSEKGGSAPMLLARSADGGKTWQRKFLNRPGVMPKLLQMSNGVLVCAFGRPGNNLMFSLDGGRSWGAEMEITEPDVRSTGYMDIYEVEPGRVLVIYDAYNTTLAKVWLWEPPDEFNGIFGVFVDVRRK